MTTSGTAVICPGALNEKNVTKTTTYTVTTPVPGSNCGPSTSSSSGGGGGGNPWGSSTGGYGSGGGGSQSSGSGSAGSSGETAPITSLPNDEGCIYPKAPDRPPCGSTGGPSGSAARQCKLKDDPPSTCLDTGSSLDIANGTYLFTETDLTVPARSIPVEMSRTFRSNQIMKSADDGKWSFAAPMDGPLGFGWHSPWFARVGDGYYLDGEGNYYTFKKDAAGRYLPHMEAGLVLTKTAAGYELIKKNENIYTFNSQGKLTSIKDARGNAVTLVYDTDGAITSVKDVMNREVLTFAYDAAGHLSTVTDIAGRTISYEHDARGNMTRVSLLTQDSEPVTLNTYEYDLTDYPVPPLDCWEGTAKGYICENNACYTGTISGYICKSPKQQENQQNNYHNMVKKTNAAGESHTIVYKPAWRNKGIVMSVIDPSGRVLDVGYGFGSGVFYNTDYNGRKYKRELNEKGNLTQLSEIDAGSERIIKKIEYFTDRTEKTIDAAGNATTVQKDEWGNIIKKIDEAGNEWRYTYTSDGKPLTITDPLGTVIKYEYDQYRNKTKEMRAAGTDDESITTYIYTQYGELESVTSGDAVTTYEYNAAGQVTKITDPLGNVTSMTYDGAGNLHIMTQPVIGDTTYSDYDYKGNPGKATDVNGHYTIYTYDSLGRVKTLTTVADNATTEYAYTTACSTGTCGSSGQGKVDYIILPEGNKIDYDYDANGNLARIYDNDGNSIIYSYDRNNNKTREDIKDSQGALQKTLSFQYDLLNRLSKTVNPDNTYTENSYDSRGNKLSVKNPNGNSTGYDYDAVNRLVRTIQPGNLTTAYTYDRRNNLTSVIDANGNRTSYEYDKQSRVTKVISPDTGTTTYAYDAAGNMIGKTDAKGVTISYVYHALNRLTKIDFPTDTDIIYTYDACVNGMGRVCTMADASGNTSYEYTAKGQVAKETKVIDGVTYVTQYTYDKNGNIKSMTYPSGKVVTYNYSNDRLVRILSNAANLATNITYKPFGGVSSLTYGNGLTGSISYDKQYRITGITAGSVMNLSYPTYDANGNITAINNVLDPTKNKSFVYDALDRHASGTGSWGTLSWTYDSVGNRLTEGATSYTYQQNSNKLNTVGGVSFGFDNNGNTTAEGARQFVYNQNQRLIRVVDAGVTKGEYTYNGNGQRIKKVVNGTMTVFHYDLRGQLIAEFDGIGVTTVEYVYLNGQPLAKIEGMNTYFYHNDHLGTPQKMTDASGTVVWTADYESFGEATVTVSTITNNLRFPGQYYNAEVGLHYNYYRDFNPATGRYLTWDPVLTPIFTEP